MISFDMKIIFLSLISFGSHFSRNAFTIFGLFLIKDGLISPAGLGILFSVVSLPSMFIPVLVGYLLDKTRSIECIVFTLLGCTVAGQVLLFLSVTLESYTFMILSMILFGCGASSITAIQRVLISYHLQGSEALGAGISIAVASLAKIFSKTLISPISKGIGSYQLALLLPGFACIVSCLDFLCFQRYYKTNYEELLSLPKSRCLSRKNSCSCYDTFTTTKNDNQEHFHKDSMEEHFDPLIPHQNTNDLCRDKHSSTHFTFSSYAQLPMIFLWLSIIHTLYIVIFHVWLNFLPHYAMIQWHMDIIDVGWLAAVPHIVTLILAPWIGYIADSIGNIMLICLFAAVNAAVVFTLIYIDIIHPYLALLLLAVSQTTLTTLTLANVSKTVLLHLLGMAFGIIEVMDALANLICNALFGALYVWTGGYSCGLIGIIILSYLSCILFCYLTFASASARQYEQLR